MININENKLFIKNSRLLKDFSVNLVIGESTTKAINNRRKIPSLWFSLNPFIREQTKPTAKQDKEVNKKLGLNASPVEKDDITLKHHTIVIAHKADNNGAKIYPFRI